MTESIQTPSQLDRPTPGDLLQSATAFAIHFMERHPGLSQTVALEDGVAAAKELADLICLESRPTPARRDVSSGTDQPESSELETEKLGIFDDESEPDNRIYRP